MMMEPRFDFLLVSLSVGVAMFASYVALNLAQSVTQAKGRSRILWLSTGALAMGFGIWSMHFIGMLAFEMPGMAMAYDVPLMLLSVLVAIVGAWLSLYIVSRPSVPLFSILWGGITMAAAIAGMHYIGMYSMRMSARIEWDLFLVSFSILIALVASFSALLILIRMRDKADRIQQLLMASTILGFAISGMHYTGMVAATFIPTTDDKIESSNLLVSSQLVFTVVVTTLLILGLALASSIGQRLLAQRSQSLGKSEEKFRLLVEAVKDYAIFMLDPKGLITTWNLGAQRITGYGEKEVVGRHVSMFYTQADIDNQTTEKELSAVIQTGHFEGEGQRARKDGSIYWASVVIAPLFDQQGSLTGFSKVIRDITQMKEFERGLRKSNEELESHVKARTRALQERENQLRTITNAAPVLIAQVDQSENLLFANESFCKWIKQEAADIMGRSLLTALGEPRYQAAEVYIRQALAGEAVNYERESLVDGVRTVLGVTFIPELGTNNVVTGFIIVASDITKHKEVQAELKQAKEAAEVANATKSAFLANMSHEIRTPLGAVIGFSELLLRDEMSVAERANSVEVIKRNGRLLSNIINDILDLSKVEAGKLEVEKVLVPFDEIMKEISSILNLEAAEKGIELNVASVGSIPTQIVTDPLRLRQVLFNIVGNAIKFTSRGSVSVKMSLTSVDAQPQKLVFAVKDTGEGIASEHIQRLFTPFTQADPSTTRKFGGTGLGLVLSKKLAQALGGDIVLSETMRGQGSTFTVTIDPGLSAEAASARPTLAMVNASKAAAKKPDGNLSLLKILVVDDSPDNQALLRRVLKIAGATVETANNGKEGVEKALAGDFSLILMDLQMPVMDGYEATKILREKGFVKPIIALTAHAMKEERQRSLESGFDDHITKPIDQVMLVKTLAEYTA